MINLRLILQILPAVVAVIALVYAYFLGRADIEKKLMKETLKNQVELNEIRNLPIDTANIIDILRSGKF